MRALVRRRATRLAVAVVLLVAGWLVRTGLFAPANPRLILDERFAVTRIFDRHGRALQALTQAEHARHRPTRLARVSPHLISATLALEDQHFWQHPGVDPVAVLRAVGQNVRAGRVVSGASTLTQQLCKWMAPQQRTFGAKISEAAAAIGLEGRLQKPEILELYLDFAPYGGLHRGAEQAAQAWLGKPAADLTLAEAAWMAVLPRSPQRLDPGRNPQAAVPAQKRLLERLRALGWYDSATIDAALSQPIAIAPDATRLRDPHLQDWAARTLQQPLANRPARIDTAIDGTLQAEIEQMARQHLVSLRGLQVGNAAVVVIDVATGEALAMVGSADYGDAGHGGANNGALALRQPGSTLKAFAYATAFEQGQSPATVLADLPAQYRTEQGLWSPGNYGGKWFGPVRARLALASSLNLAAVQLADSVGVSAILASLQAAGISTLQKTAAHYGLALVLGDGEVSLLELTAAFSVLARGGLYVAPTLVRQVVDQQGAATAVKGSETRQVFAPQTAWQVASVLSDPQARSLAFGRGGPLEMPFAVAAKTGTSKGFRDNWALGTTSQFAVGVWVGNFDGAPMRDVSGTTGAAPLLRDVLWRLHRDRRPADFARPAGLQDAAVCALSGLVATAACPHTVAEALRPEQLPRPCDWHARAATGDLVLNAPAKFRSWALQNPELAAQVQRSAAADLNGRPVALVQPLDGAALVIDPHLPAAKQQVALRAQAADRGWRLRWQVDGTAAGETAADEPAFWQPTAGEHSVTVAAVAGDGTVAGTARARVSVSGRVRGPEP